MPDLTPEHVHSTLCQDGCMHSRYRYDIETGRTPRWCVILEGPASLDHCPLLHPENWREPCPDAAR